MFLLGVEFIFASYAGTLLYEKLQRNQIAEPKKSEEKVAGDTVDSSTQVMSRSIQVKKADGDGDHLSDTRANMLSIRVGDSVCAIASEQVQHIDYVDSITVLPFTHAPIEGLAHFNGQPLLQIDVATALGLKQQQPTASKRLLVNTVQGHFALRVDDVLDFAKKQPITRVLPLSEILPQSLKSKKSASLLQPNHQPVASQKQQKLTVLLVASGDNTLALLTHNIDHIQEMTGLPSLNGQNSQTERLLKVKDHLLPTHSLGQLLGLKPTEKPESLAIIMRSEPTGWALRVEHVIALEEITQVYSSGTDEHGLWSVTQSGEIRELMDVEHFLKSADFAMPPRLWYVTPQGQIQELVDAENLLTMQTMPPLAITITAPQETASILQASERLITAGLQIYCGGGRYLLPLTMARQTLKDLEPSSITAARFPTGYRLNRSKRIPWINAMALLFGEPNGETDCTVLITLGNDKQILLGVDRIVLSQSLTALKKWVTVTLPDPVALFFDAGYYDDASGQWILRVVDTVKFSCLPWAIKKAFVKAIIGWVDSSSVTTMKTLPD